MSEITEMCVADTLQLPFDEAEVALINRLDELVSLGDDDPLVALDGLIALMIQINAEIIKCGAPAILEYGHIKAAEFAQTGVTADMPKQLARATASMHRTQESLAKLGTVRVRTMQALKQREQQKTIQASVDAKDAKDAEYKIHDKENN